MNRLSERVLLGGFLNGLMVLASASCSSTPSPADGGSGAGSGNNTATGGNNTATGGGTATGGSSTGFGGSPSGGAGGSGVGVGGGVAQGGAAGHAGGGGVAGGAAGGAHAGAGGGAAMTCSSDANLTKADGCFVGCDPALTTDNPQGIQGAFYTYGDGASASGGAPKSCKPLVDPPCSDKGICLSGATLADMDFTNGWGCGMGLALNAAGDVKSAYTGPAGCFTYTLTGNSGGNEMRVGFTQTAEAGTAPYVSIPAFTGGATGTVCIKDATCHGDKNCTPVSATAPKAFDIQFGVVGANHAGTYDVCLTSLTPVTSGNTTLTARCGMPNMPNADVESVGKYDLHNNINNDPNGTQCVTPTQSGSAVGFTIASSNVRDPNTAPAAYPSLVDGWHYGEVSNDPALPKAMSALMSANSSVTFTGSASKYNAAYDIWVLPTLPSASVKDPSGGLEVMIWLDHTNPPVPAAPSTGATFMSGYQVYSGTVSTWNYVAYVGSGKTFNGDLKPFIQDAITRKGTQQSAAAGGPWLAGIEFGFELYGSGNGLAVTSFTSDVK
ncbi:MAG: hypothetical protein ABJB12_02390 [Pseudomonadota bacterium]